ncbi:MAG: hypothetical protein Q8K92_26255 [Leadbetterella sp.]|nr:hypothetical protein [Leadbetterella sp.]
MCKNKESFFRELRKNGIKKKNRPAFNASGTGATTHFIERNGIKIAAIICMDEKHKKDYTKAQIVGLITHEAVHVWQEIKVSMGEHDPSSEFESYSVQMLTQRIFEAYYK